MNRLPPAFKTTELGPLPEEWEVLQLGDAAGFVMGQSPPSETYNLRREGLPFLQGKAEFGDKYPTPIKWCSQPLKVGPENSILISVRAPVGDVNIAPTNYCIGRGLAAIEPKVGTNNEFLFYWLRFSKKRFEEQSSGSTFKSINKGVLHEFNIPLPPLPEQRAVAHVLRTVQQAKEDTEKVIAATRELKKSLMRHLFTYGPVPVEEAESVPLKEIAFGSVPKHWEVVRLGEVIAAGPQNGIYKPQSLYGKGTPIVRIDDFGNEGGTICYTPNRVQLSAAEAENYRLNPNDILINRVNSLSHLGKSVLVASFTEPAVFESNMMRLSIDEASVAPEYMSRFLSSPVTREQMRGKAKRAVAQSSINQGDVRSLTLSLPPLPEQQEITRILEAVDEKISTEENRKRTLEALFKTLLHHLMTGKLRVAT